jgi:hypothetical protein
MSAQTANTLVGMFGSNASAFLMCSYQAKEMNDRKFEAGKSKGSFWSEMTFWKAKI